MASRLQFYSDCLQNDINSVSDPHDLYGREEEHNVFRYIDIYVEYS